MAQPQNFGFGIQEQMLKTEAKRFFKKRWNEDKLTALLDSEPMLGREADFQWEEKIWREAVELGWSSVAISNQGQGSKMSAVGVAALIEEAGRAAFPFPLLSTIHASYLLHSCRTKEAEDLLHKIAGGKCAGMALMDRNGSWKNGQPQVLAHADSCGVRLNGTAFFVQNALKLDYFIVRCAFKNGQALVAVPKNAPGLTIVSDLIVSLTCRQARLQFKETQIEPEWIVARAGSAEGAVKSAEPAIFTILAADMVGAAQWQLKTTADYAKSRVQFDRPIGFFQAVKHPIVNMMLMIDEAKSLVYNAACALDHEPEKSLLYAHMAKSSAGDMAQFCSDRSVQLHGGMGFTWQCPVHVYFKRQLHHLSLFGDGRYHRMQLAEMMMGSS